MFICLLTDRPEQQGSECVFSYFASYSGFLHLIQQLYEESMIIKTSHVEAWNYLKSHNLHSGLIFIFLSAVSG